MVSWRRYKSRWFSAGKGELPHRDWTGGGETLGNGMEVGIVLELLSKSCLVDRKGESVRCSYRGRLFEKTEDVKSPVVPGDRAYFTLTAEGEGVIEEITPRKNKLSRPASFHHHIEQVMVANVDSIVIVSSAKAPAFRAGLIDRVLVAAAREEILAMVCLNKIDLMGEENYQDLLQPFEELDYAVFFTSVVSGEGIGELKGALRGKIAVFVGHSGVGKSSIVNALSPDLHLKVGEVSRTTGKGRHVTASTKLHRIAEETFVVDTPGVREFGLWEITRDDLAFFFPGISMFAGTCRFSRCTHTHEPNCGVKKALEGGKISKERYHAYLKILKTLE